MRIPSKIYFNKKRWYNVFYYTERMFHYLFYREFYNKQKRNPLIGLMPNIVNSMNTIVNEPVSEIFKTMGENK